MAIRKSTSCVNFLSPYRPGLAVFHSVDSLVPLTSQPGVFVPRRQLCASCVRQSCHSVSSIASVFRHPYYATESPAPAYVVPTTSRPVPVTDRYVFAPFLSQMSPSLLRLTRRVKQVLMAMIRHPSIKNPATFAKLYLLEFKGLTRRREQLNYLKYNI